MAVESKTVGDLVDIVQFHLTGDPTGFAASSAEEGQVKIALGLALRQTMRYTWHPAFRTEATFATVSGTDDYELASDAVAIIDPSFRHTSSPYETLRYIDNQQYDRVDGESYFQDNDRPAYYTLRARDATSGHMEVRVYPTPDAAYTINYWYFALPNDITASTTDATELDERYPRDLIDAIVWRACLMLATHCEREQILVFKDFLNEAMRAVRKSTKPVAGRIYEARPFRKGDIPPFRTGGTVFTTLTSA